MSQAVVTPERFRPLTAPDRLEARERLDGQPELFEVTERIPHHPHGTPGDGGEPVLREAIATRSDLPDDLALIRTALPAPAASAPGRAGSTRA